MPIICGPVIEARTSYYHYYCYDYHDGARMESETDGKSSQLRVMGVA